MKNIFGLIVLIHNINVTYAQNSNLDFSKALKISNLTTYEKLSTYSVDANGNKLSSTAYNLDLFSPTIALQWKTKKNNFNEIELTHLTFSNHGDYTEMTDSSSGQIMPTSGSDVLTAQISLKYEWILNLNKSKDKKIIPSLGFAVNPYFSHNGYKSRLSNVFPVAEQNVGLRTFITPRLTYFLSSKFFIDVNIPVCISEMNILTAKVENPVIPVEERNVHTININTTPALLNFRIGIGLKL